jgi:Tfp pilus assembly protein PilV
VTTGERRASDARKRPAESAGIALVELVISVVVFGWVVLAVFPLFLSSVESNVAARFYGEANGLARAGLESLLDVPFQDPALSPGRHEADDLPETVADPETGVFPSSVPNPFRRTYRVEQFRIPASATVPRDAPFVAVRVTAADARVDFKRIDVSVEQKTPRPGLGRIAARVSALLPNPAPETFLSAGDPDP